MVLVGDKVNDNDYKLASTEDFTKGFVITEKEQSNPFSISINCDKELKIPAYEVGTNSLTIKSKSSCGIVNEAARVFFNNKIVFSLVFMALGTILMIFGGYKWDFILIGVGFFAGFTFVFFLFWAFVQYDQGTKSYIIISVIAVVIGCILGYICKLFDFVSFFSIGFFGGFFLSKFLFVTFPIASMENWVVTMLTYIIAVVLGVICIFLGKYFMVIITAVIGSIMFWYNFGFLIGVLPNMFDFFEKFKTYGKLDTLNIVFLVLAGLTAFGFVILQYKLIAREKAHKELHTDEKRDLLL